MTLSKLVPQSVAQQLLTDHPATALDLALEIVRIVAVGKTKQVRERADTIARSNQIAADEIITVACRYFGFSEKMLRCGRKSRTVARARHVAWYLVRERLGWSYDEIGDLFDRDHTTVISGIGNVDPFDEDVLGICASLDAGAEAAE